MHALADGLAVHYDDLTGDASEPALVCLPGWCATRKAFTALARAFGGRRRVIALDWRGHGDSARPDGDFDGAALERDVRAVLAAAGVRRAIPVATAHAGWIAIGLRRALGPEFIPKLVLIDWIVGPAPPPFLGALAALQDESTWQPVRDRLFAMWTEGVADPAVLDFVHREMGAFGFDMWARAGREIAAAYAHAGSPLEALARLAPPPPTLHLYAQGDDGPQQAFAAAHPWFRPTRLDGHSHFPTIESAAALVPLLEGFVAE